MKRINMLMVIVFLLGASYSNPGYSQETYEFLLEWRTPGHGVRGFAPTAVTTDPFGNVYVADAINNQIQKFDSNGNFISMFDFDATNAPGFTSIPHGISVDSSGNVYAVVSVSTVAFTTGPPPVPYIYKFDSNGNFTSRWGISGTIENDSGVRRGIAVDPWGNVYVADSINNWIQEFDSDGNLLTQWGPNGTGDGQFNHPGGVAVDGSGNIYVADTWNQRIQKFDSSATFMAKWGFSSEFDYPYGIAGDLSGNIYVLLQQKVEKFDSDGNFITEWGSYGQGKGQFCYPRGLAVDLSGNVYVADLGNNRIQKFSLVLPPIILESPPIGKSFNACSSYSLPAFAWDVSGSFTGYRIEFSPDKNFTSVSLELAASSSDTQISIPLDVWAEIMDISWTSGVTTYWRVAGTMADGTTEISGVRSFTVRAEPAEYPSIYPTIKNKKPTLFFSTNCNTKFKVWFGSDSNFSEKTYSVEIENPSGNEEYFSMTLTSLEWSRIKQLVQNRANMTIYWYIESWDDSESYNRTEVISFDLLPPPKPHVSPYFFCWYWGCW
jgi:sugar lactone lactonase YvrE